MLVLFETAAGYALFKCKQELKEQDYHSLFADPETASKTVKLKAFGKFEDTTEALAAATAVVEGKLTKQLKGFLKENIVDKGLKTVLAVADKKIGGLIKEKLGIQIKAGAAVDELMRGMRSQIATLIQGLQESDLKTMSLGLAHSYSRYKLKFNPEKTDTMIVQAISLLDDLDKELNIYAMRVREWFGWHFPEMSKVVTDNTAYSRVVLKGGMRTNFVKTDFADILPEDVEAELKEIAEMSMGVEIAEFDLLNIQQLCQQVIDISEYRAQLYDYLKNRMHAIAPNLTTMVGELVGARLIAHAGSLLNLAKQPASTVQILGAEKALFRALKTKSKTPKYGLIYHTSVVGQSAPANKGKMSRVLAAKTSLVTRVDALSDTQNLDIGLEYRAKVESRMRQLEGKGFKKAAGSAPATGPTAVVTKTPVAYNDATDVTAAKPESEMDEDEDADADKKKKKKKKEKKEKKAKKRKAADVEDEDEAEGNGEAAKPKKKSIKKKKKRKTDDE